MSMMPNRFDVVVVGGGHAGVEAALAAARIGLRTALITLDKTAIARMSCNPAIGGIAKGHLVREIDALGGQMALAADTTGIQFKTLNKSKGRAVRAPRAQIDKKAYERFIQSSILDTTNLTVLEGEATSLTVSENTITGLSLDETVSISAVAVVITCGTFLNGLIHIGKRKITAGRMGEEASTAMTESLISHGFKAGRLKTGTPPRLREESIDWSKLDPVHGDEDPKPFSFRTEHFSPLDEPCYIAKTNQRTHQIIRNALHLSAMYSGQIKGIGPRYCPSIEDKVVRFSSKSSHQLFLEPEWLGSNQIYTNGFSTSLPESIQLGALRSIEGLENVEFVRPGYAIEYDFFPPWQLKASLETKLIRGLFLAGQINGSSGYEEAAAQGIIAGINAARYVKGDDPIVLSRDQAYIGVLIDDLVTKDTLEPYRMFTSRAEYRLMLRCTNADRRLINIGLSIGLIDEKTHCIISRKLQCIDLTVEQLKASRVSRHLCNELLATVGEKPVNRHVSMASLLRRPRVTVSDLRQRGLFPVLNHLFHNSTIISEILEEVEAIIKYEGYIKRQIEQVAAISRNESTIIPPGLDFRSIQALSYEAREKLSLVRPESLGQASRISGVSPADISVLSVILSR